MTFATPLTKGGNYTLALARGDRRSGGQLDRIRRHRSLPAHAGHDSLPTVSSVTPSGLTNADVSSLSVTFDKAINASTFTSSAGDASAGPPARSRRARSRSPRLTPRDYTVAFPTQTQEGTYNVSIGGPGVLDISGNAMTAAYQTSFTIDHSVLSVVSVEPDGHGER